MKKCFFGFVFLFVLAIPFAYSQDASSFISDYNDEQNLYDYHGVLSNPSEVERLLQNFEEWHNARLILVTLNDVNDISTIIDYFDFNKLGEISAGNVNYKTSQPETPTTSCVVMVLFSEQEVVIGSRGCVDRNPEIVLELSYLHQEFTTKQYEKFLNDLLTEIFALFPKRQAPSNCESDFNDGIRLMADSDYDAAYSKFQEVYKNCIPDILSFRARYLQAYIKYSLQDYEEASVIAVELFNFVESSYPNLAREALKLAILSYRNAGNCEKVRQLSGKYQIRGYELDEEVSQAFQDCGAPSTPILPFCLDINNRYAELYNAGKCQELVQVFSPMDYIQCVSSDRDNAQRILTFVIECELKLRCCVAANEMYRVLFRDFGDNEEIKSELNDMCPSTQPQSLMGRALPPEGTLRWVQAILRIAHQNYEGGNYIETLKTVIYLEDFFEQESNRVYFNEEWENYERLKILAYAKSIETGAISCEAVTAEHMYRLNYFVNFGQNDEIEAAIQAAIDPSGNYIPVSQEGLCQTSWPTNEGPLVGVNSNLASCALFETGSTDFDFILDDALKCCERGNDNSFLCKEARLESTLLFGNRKKRCVGIYIIKALGSYSKYVKEYFMAEANCARLSTISSPSYFGTCNADNMGRLNRYANSLPCRLGPEPIWNSDTDMSENNCYMVDVPAHATINILQTGTSVDYSVALTTLLRRAGYEPNEVYTMVVMKHAGNLVKLPGDWKYHYVDVTGNLPVFLYLKPLGEAVTSFSAVWYILTSEGGDVKAMMEYLTTHNLMTCMNDKGMVECPSAGMVSENLLYKLALFGRFGVYLYLYFNDPEALNEYADDPDALIQLAIRQAKDQAISMGIEAAVGWTKEQALQFIYKKLEDLLNQS